jgi:hypothetical protein
MANNSCHGKIHLSSVQGEGSVFSIYLPAAELNMAPRPKADAIDPGGDERILIVDWDQQT